VKLIEVPEKPLNMASFMMFAHLVENRAILEVKIDSKQANLVSLVSTTTNASINGNLRAALDENFKADNQELADVYSKYFL
jgi:hypothetical protein